MNEHAKLVQNKNSEQLSEQDKYFDETNKIQLFLREHFKLFVRFTRSHIVLAIIKIQIT